MIKFVVTRNGYEADIRFPCEEKDIRRVQNELEIPYETDTRVKVLAVDSDIEQLSVLEGQNADLDFLNLLGRVMYGMDQHEYDQFRMGLYHESPAELKDIINISRAVNRYSIITDDLYESGLDHELDVRGGIPTSEVDITDYTVSAKKLLDSGKCTDTPYGKLYVNEGIPIEEFFDGVHMPPYIDRQFQVACFLDNGTDRDFLMLPCTDAELLRSARRLGTSFPYDLKVQIEDFTNHNDPLISRLVTGADIYTLNRYASLTDRFDEDDMEKYLTAVGYVDRYFGGVRDLRNAVDIGERLGSFSFYPNAMSYEELGQSLLNEQDVPEELHGYFDTEKYGEDYLGEQAGRFTESGYIGIRDYDAVRPLLQQTAGMGGMV
jgi:hypothetical protein